MHCVRGRMFDVAVDLRRESATFRQWIGGELEAGEPTGLFIPHGVAHGFLTLEPDTDVLYQFDRGIAPDLMRAFAGTTRRSTSIGRRRPP